MLLINNQPTLTGTLYSSLINLQEVKKVVLYDPVGTHISIDQVLHLRPAFQPTLTHFGDTDVDVSLIVSQGVVEWGKKKKRLR